MSDLRQGTAYRFTDGQRKFILDTGERLRLTTGVRVEIDFAIVNGFSAYEVVLHDHGHVRRSGMVLVQSLQVDEGGIEFAVRGFDGGTVGPKASYPVFQEAVVFADVFARKVIQSIPTPTQSEPPVSERSGTDDLLSTSDVRLIYAFGEALGRTGEVPCSTEIREFAPGAVSIGFFLVVNRSPVLLGSMVVTRADSGGLVASVRSFNNSPVLDESFFPGLAEALIAVRPYFAKIAQTTRKFVHSKTLLGRMRGAMGF